MTEVADKDVSTSAGATEKPAPEKPKLTVRSAASIALVVVGGVAAVGLLAAGGWIAAAAVPTAAATGLYARHRMKNPKRSTRSKGKLAWPLTGNQSRRALLPRGLGGKSSPSNKGTRSGSPGRKSGSARTRTGLSPRAGGLLPKTTRSRARAGAGGVLPKRNGSRAVKRSHTTRPSTSFAGVRPLGTKRPSTPSKTPARPSKAPRLASGQSKARPSGSGSSMRRGGRSALPKTSARPTSRSKPKSGKSTTPGRSSTSSRRPSFGKFRSPFRPTSATPGRRPGRTMRQRLNPFRRTSPSGKHSTARNPWKRTKPKMKTGDPNRMRARDRVPRRSPRRPTPYKRAPARKLWRMALGLPKLQRGRVTRPTVAQRRRARRTLRLRSLTRLWSLRRLPGWLSRAYWDRLFSRVPNVDLPTYEPTTQPDPPKPPTPPSGPGLAKVIPINRKETFNIMSDGPHGVIAEAFNQLAQFEPQTAGEWERFLAAQQELFTGMSQAYATLAERAQSGMAFNAQTSAALQDLAAAVGTLSDMAEQSHQAFGYNQ